MSLHVLREHGLAAVVSVPGPVHHLQPPGLRAQPVESGLRPRGVAAEKRRSSGGGSGRTNLQELFATEPPLHGVLLVHSGPPSLSLVAWWADDPHHFGELLAAVRDSVRSGAAVIDAVASFQLQELAAEVELDSSRE